MDALASRRAEIEEAITRRAFSVAEPSGAETPGYVEGLRAAIAAAVDHALMAIGRGVERAGATPPPVLAQARKAARSRVGLEVVLRRYAAGYSALIDFLLEEIRGLDQTAEEVGSVLQGELTSLFDRLVEAVSHEYREELERMHRSDSLRRGDQLRRLLAGEAIERSKFNYDFDAHHLGAIVGGPGPEELLRQVASRLDRRLLLLGEEDGTYSAWLGGRHALSVEEVGEIPRFADLRGHVFVLGEPGLGVRGWRLTHRQARRAFGLVLRRPRPFTRYAEIALLATVAEDPDLVAFLEQTFLSPLEAQRDGGRAWAETVRAYLDAGCNLSAAAAALGIARQTVASRLRVIERELDRPVDGCLAELEMALGLRALAE
jgi:PucR C-terminal helix-turn-helix domain